MELKRHFGWKQEQTALQYTDARNDRAKKMPQLLTNTSKEDEDDNRREEQRRKLCSTHQQHHL